MANNYLSKVTKPDFWKKPISSWSNLLILIGLALVVLLIAGLASKLLFQKSTETTNKESTVLPLASGKQTYEIIANGSKKLKIIEVEVDPLDVKQGEIQRVTVRVEDIENNPITQENKVKAVVYTDNKSFPFSLSLKNVTDSDASTVTVWQGLWACQDTYDSKYTITVTAKSATQEHSIDLTFK